MLPVFYETTVVAVDDDTQFLESLTYRFRNKINLKTFSSPTSALNYVMSNLESPVWSILRNNRIHSDTSMDEPGLRVDLPDLMRLADVQARPQQVTVVVVDYAMPEMDGLEFFKKLSQTPLKKILLTGKAGLDVAVTAFNSGLIDTFQKKGDYDVGKKLIDDIHKLQFECFHNASAVFRQLAKEEEYSFLMDAEFEKMFNIIREENKIVEYFFLASTSEFLLIDACQKRYRLLVRDEETMRAQFETASSASAPSDLLSLLEGRSLITDFPTDGGFYDPIFSGSWKKYVYPANKLGMSWQWTIIPV